jgi:hypothetical protein
MNPKPFILTFCFLAIGTVAACKGQWIATHEYSSYKETRRVTCYALGYCRSCSWVTDFYHICTYGPYNRCPGHRLIMVEVTPEDGYYINYPDKIVQVKRERFVKELTPCTVDPQYRLQDGQYQANSPE